MAEAIVDDLVDGWINSRLTGDPALAGLIAGRVYNTSAPDELPSGGTVPDAYVEFSFVDGEDEATPLVRLGGHIQTTATYLVKVVGRGRDSGRLRPVLQRLDALLDGAEGPIEAHWVTCERLGPERYLETVDGVHWWHRGARYQLTIHTA